MHKVTRVALTTLAGLTLAGSAMTVSANAATVGPHNTYAHHVSVSAASTTVSDTWYQYQNSNTYNEELHSVSHSTNGSGYDHWTFKHDVNGRWTSHLTGWTRTAGGKSFTWVSTYKHN